MAEMTASQTGSLIISGAQVWDGIKQGFVERDLCIEDGLVVDCPTSHGTDGDPDIVDGAGKWVVPGLIDAHFHAYAVSMDGLENERGPLSFTALNGAKRLGAALKRGFTTVRDVAGGDIGLQRAVDRALFPSPRYLFTGPALSQTGGHGDPRSEMVDICFSSGHMCEVVDGVDDLRRAVRERFRTGAHAIKIMTSGGVFSLTDPLSIPQYSAEEIRAVADEARRRGSYVTAHCYSVDGVMLSIENGVTCIEHGNLIDSATAKEMAARGTRMVPTLAAYDAMARRGAELGLNATSLAKNDLVLSQGQEACQVALAAGVEIGFGTDLMGGLEDDQLRGIALQIDAIGVEQTLHAMTAGNASILGDSRLGHLGAGACGDAVVLTGNPIHEPDALSAEDARFAVVQNGRVVGSES